MIIGDPYKFAVLFDKVDDWNSEYEFHNGVLLLSIDGKLFLNRIVNTVVSGGLFELRDSMKNIPVNSEIYSMEKETALKKLYSLVYPDDYDIDNDYSFDLTPSVLSDNNSFVFFVSNGDKIRILASSMKYDSENSVHILENVVIREIFLSKEYWNKITVEIDKYINHLTLQ